HAKTSLKDTVQDGLIAGDRKLALEIYRADHVENLALGTADQPDRDVEWLGRLEALGQRPHVTGDLPLDIVQGEASHINIAIEAQVDHAVGADDHVGDALFEQVGTHGDLKLVRRLDHIRGHRYLIKLARLLKVDAAEM